MGGEDTEESNNSFTTPGIHREKAWHLPFQSTLAVYGKGPGDFLGRSGKEDLCQQVWSGIHTQYWAILD